MPPDRIVEQQYIEVGANTTIVSRNTEQVYAEAAINQSGAVQSSRLVEQVYVESSLNKVDASFRNIEQLYLEVAMPRRPALAGWGILLG